MVLEMHYMGKATTESDLYNFGILMLEVLWDKRPVILFFIFFEANEREFIARKTEQSPSSATRPGAKQDTRLATNYQLMLTLGGGSKFQQMESPFLLQRSPFLPHCTSKLLRALLPIIPRLLVALARINCHAILP
jgi:hypothetical protein